MQKLLIDLFAGGGGASQGIEDATGRNIDYAVNHDPDAILMHKTNHPETVHLQENIWDVNPLEVTKGRPVGLLWASPDCKHFSKAKGSKPKDKNIRMLPYSIIKWARLVRPEIIIAENVEEIQTWGPLNKKGRPIDRRKGETFKQFIRKLMKLGYKVEWRELVAADYGAPTTRKRWYMIARCDGKPIIWPKPTHSKNGDNGLEKWVPVSTCLDFSDLGKSIFGRKKPLAKNTMNRTAKGIDKFIFNNPEPFIVQTNHGGSGFRGQSIREPMPTITQKHGFGIVAPVMVQIGQTGFSKDRSRALDSPLSTIVTKQEHCLVTPILIQYHSETTKQGVRSQTVNNPIMTIDSSPRYALASCFLTKFYKSGIGQSLNEPLHTITTSPGHFGEVKILMVDKNEAENNLSIKDQNIRNDFVQKCNWVSSFIIEYYGSGTGQVLTDPLHTVVTKDRFALITVYGIDYVIVDITLRMLTARELFRAQGFPESYIIDRDYTGKYYPISKQVARCGNSVVPIMARFLAAENYVEQYYEEIAV